MNTTDRTPPTHPEGKRSPWLWIPTTYMAEGLPYFAVNTLTVLMYHNMGIGLAEMAFFTGWLYLPWVIKPFWSPFVDLIKTKRRWTIAMQFLMAFSLGAVGLFLPSSFFFTATLILFWLTAFFSATHDIAADGYYMIELSAHDQAAFVGVRSTFFRIASVIGQGGLVMLAGYLEQTRGSVSEAWSLVFMLLGVIFLLTALYHTRFMPRSGEDRPMPGVTPSTIMRDFARTFVTFFRKPDIVPALLFMLFYRLPEAMCLTIYFRSRICKRNRRCGRASCRRHTRRYRHITRRIEKMAMANGSLSYTSLRVLLRSGYVAAGEFLAHMRRHIHRTVRIRIRIYGIHALPHIFQPG